MAVQGDTIGDLTEAMSAAGGDLIELEVGGLSRKITKDNYMGGSLVGGGVIDTGGFTLTVPATGTAALLGTAQTFSALKTFSTGISLGDDTFSRYVQGTLWTPAITGSSSNPTVTYSTQFGRYARIGRLVFISIHLQLTNISGGSGAVQIEMPFPAMSSTQTRFSLQVGNITFSGTPISVALGFFAGSGGTSVLASLDASYNGAASQSVQISGLANNSQIIASGVYLTSAA